MRKQLAKVEVRFENEMASAKLSEVVSFSKKNSLENARTQGKRVGRPPMLVDRVGMARLRAQGHSMREIAEEMGVSPEFAPASATLAQKDGSSGGLRCRWITRE